MKIKQMVFPLTIAVGVSLILLALLVASLNKTRQFSRELSEMKEELSDMKDYVRKLPPPPSFRQLPHPQMEDSKEISANIDLKRGDRK